MIGLIKKKLKEITKIEEGRRRYFDKATYGRRKKGSPSRKRSPSIRGR